MNADRLRARAGEVLVGAHTRISAPRARNRTARPTTGSTHPRDPDADTNTGMRSSHFRRFWPVPVIVRHDSGQSHLNQLARTWSK